MMSHIVVHSTNPPSALLEKLSVLCNSDVQHYSGYHAVSFKGSLTNQDMEALSDRYKVDINRIPESVNAGTIGLLITDMDSTLITIECVDEIADYAGKKAEVSAITEAAMRGELDFNESLKRRVALLKGLDADVLDDVYNHRLRLNSGAEKLIHGLKQLGIKTALVSSGFTFFTDKLSQRLGFDFVLSNVLAINDNKLAGEVSGKIVNADTKARFLQDICALSNISTNQAIAAGDGANDLKMMKLSGMSVAFRAKSVVREQADIKINYSGLDSILHILEYGRKVL